VRARTCVSLCGGEGDERELAEIGLETMGSVLTGGVRLYSSFTTVDTLVSRNCARLPEIRRTNIGK
jgi:hypothetical protein